MDYEKSHVEHLTDYFTQLYRSDERLEASSRNIFGDFVQNVVVPSGSIDANELINALENDSEDYDWRKFETEFQAFLERRLDRHHNGSLDNPEVEQNDFEVERHYNLGYISTEISSPEVEEVFMTSIIQFEEPDDDGYAIEVEYLDEEESLEAIEHLLEEGERDKVDEMLRFGLKINEDRALKAYEAVASLDLDLAEKLRSEIEDPNLQDSMQSIIAENSGEA